MGDAARIFITGATGDVGRALVDELLRAGYPVRALVRSTQTPAARALAAKGVRLVSGDVTDRQSMHAAVHQADLVIHLAGIFELGAALSERASMTAVNVQGTDNVLGLALELGCPRVLLVNCTLACGDSGPQARDERYRRGGQDFASHLEWTLAEALALGRHYVKRGLPLVVACSNGVAGVNARSVFGHLLRMHVNGVMPPVAPCPDSVLPLVHVADLARGLAAAALHGRAGQTYFFSGERTTLREIFSLWHELVPGGMRVRLWVPQWTGWLLLAPVGPLLRAAGLSAFLSAEVARQAGRHADFSAAKARHELGWHPMDARTMWRLIGEQEQALLAQRRNQSLMARLKPLGPDDV